MMKIKLQFPPVRLRILLLGIVAFCFVSGVSAEQQHIRLASAYELTLNEPSNQMDALVSIQLKDAKVKELLDAIEGKSGFKFVYDKSVLGYDVSFTLEEEKIPLYHLLQKVSNQSDLRFKQVNENINVRLVEREQQQSAANAMEVTVTGTVVDQNGDPIPGATVSVPGEGIGTATDIDGSYSITVPDGVTLVFSFVGFESQSIAVGDQSVIDVTLIEDISALDEVVVVGYGTQRRGSITGAISSVSTQDIQELPVADAGSALQGRVSGVMVMSEGNRPGDGVSIRIRGRRSLTANNDPLYVVDGIPYQGNINDINPKDIKSMEVLKDASATAIYGSRGANGVILITTHRGGDFPTVVSYNGYYGISSPLGKPNMMNSEQYVRMREVGGRTFNAPELDAIERGVNTDWIDLVTENGYQQNHQLGIRGGNTKTGFSISANIFEEQAVVENQDFQRKSFRTNFDHQVSGKFRVGVSLQISDQLTNYGTNLYGEALSLMPIGEPYDSDGNLLHQPGADPLRWNPLMDLISGNFVDERNRLRVFGNLFMELDITEDLTFRMNYGPDYQKYNQGRFRGSLSSARKYASPDAYKYESSTYTYTVENILNYSKRIDENNNLRFTGVFSVQEYSATDTEVLVQDLPYEHQLFHNISTAETVLDYSSDLSEWGIMSFMGRANYDLMGKYLFTLTGRYDGSSRLSEGRKFGFFPSAAFLWRVNSEDFMADQKIFSELSLRVSYGKTGNTAIDPYQTRGNLSRTIYNFADVPAYGYRPGGIANPDLRWESSATANIGIDFGFGASTFGTLEFYQTNTTDLLLERNLPITSGFNSIMQNVGETQNSGLEFSLTSEVVNSNSFIWSANLNLFGNREKIINLYGNKEINDVGNQWFIGEPLSVYYDYDKIGVWQLGEEDEATVYQVEPGIIKVRDVNGDGTINQDDRVILGTDIPFATIGLGSRFSYKNFDLSFLLLSIMGHTIYNQFEVAQSTLQGRNNNLNVDYWTEDNPTNDHPKPDASRENPLYGSTRGYQPGDFLKVKNFQIGYSVPNNVLSRIGADSMRIYFNADSPLILSHLGSNMDPEIYGGTIGRNTPSTRMFSLGLNIDF